MAFLAPGFNPVSTRGEWAGQPAGHAPPSQIHRRVRYPAVPRRSHRPLHHPVRPRVVPLDGARSRSSRIPAYARIRRVLAEARPGPAYLERVLVRTGARAVFLRVDEIDWLEAEENYVRLHAGPES
jgi:hypothetical protein